MNEQEFFNNYTRFKEYEFKMLAFVVNGMKQSKEDMQVLKEEATKAREENAKLKEEATKAEEEVQKRVEEAKENIINELKGQSEKDRAIFNGKIVPLQAKIGKLVSALDRAELESQTKSGQIDELMEEVKHLREVIEARNAFEEEWKRDNISMHERCKRLEEENEKLLNRLGVNKTNAMVEAQEEEIKQADKQSRINIRQKRFKVLVVAINGFYTSEENKKEDGSRYDTVDMKKIMELSGLKEETIKRYMEDYDKGNLICENEEVYGGFTTWAKGGVRRFRNRPSLKQ